jgi:hypothetical protein
VIEGYKHPKRGLLVLPAEVGGHSLVADTYVWILGSDGVHARIGYRDCFGTVRLAAVVETPVPAPSIEQLRDLDPCFGLEPGAFEGEVVYYEWMYRIFRCKAHGRHFIGVMYGGIGMWERVTLLEPGEETNPKAAYDRYIAMSNDWLNLMGRSR